MYRLLLLLSLAVFAQFELAGQAIFDLEPSQSMSITGKGPGQDAAKNPYLGTNCIGIVENIGKNQFYIRIQEKGTLIQTITIQPKEIKRVDLQKGYELYLDTELRAKAKVEFQKTDL